MPLQLEAKRLKLLKLSAYFLDIRRTLQKGQRDELPVRFLQLLEKPDVHDDSVVS